MSVATDNQTVNIDSLTPEIAENMEFSKLESTLFPDGQAVTSTESDENVQTGNVQDADTQQQQQDGQQSETDQQKNVSPPSTPSDTVDADDDFFKGIDLSAMPPETQEKLKRKVNGVRGNVKQTADANAQLKQQLAAYAQQQKDAQEQAIVDEYNKALQYINALPTSQQRLNPQTQEIEEYNPRAEAMTNFQQRQRADQLNAFANFLNENVQQVAQDRLEMLRETLPATFTDMAGYIAEKVDAAESADAMKQIVSYPPFKELLATYENPKEIRAIGETLVSVGMYFADQEKARKANNATNAANTGVHNTTQIAGGAGGTESDEKIFDTIPANKWKEFSDKFMETRNAALARSQVLSNNNNQ